MVAAFKEYVIDFADLKLSIVCNKCQTEMIIDPANMHNLKLLERCTACRNEFDENFKRALNDFLSAQLTFSKKANNLPATARIRVSSEC